ncbi:MULTISPECIES: sugar phosphate isomerase/epimerase [unclassified Microbacterium]|uniref:sugar phosphate isomerase/epimerase family protein n=1 Tax=unclassified Microbacterium TaxID=2609290 RepID=UPI000EAA7402|nr:MULTISPECIES: TIM barrel protein [unclassified Microbacterium]MBT2486480.1 sugar phosphate isomerase/epimerase [Microbacterium sp. ISL-108]RKN69177.1 sugar phosphate isomerase/epimerase [Microbacterium sp. CGR2]
MIGLGTYAYFWRHSDRALDPLSLVDAFEDTREQGVELFQICDYAPLESMSDALLREAASAARDLGITIELGTKGIAPEHLTRFLEIAEIFDVRLLRSMVYGPDSRPSTTEAETWLRSSIRAFESAGVTLALETYEQMATTDLVGLVERVDSPHLGICLDPANVVARLEQPRICVEQTSALVKNVHVKDFAFARQDGWVGFTYSGTAMGTGMHDYPQLLSAVRPRERGINEIVEHWLPWQSDAETTIRTEREWTRITLEYLRSTS